MSEMLAEKTSWGRVVKSCVYLTLAAGFWHLLTRGFGSDPSFAAVMTLILWMECRK